MTIQHLHQPKRILLHMEGATYGRSSYHLLKLPMIRRKENYIGINQNVPFKVLDAGLYRLLLTGDLDKSEILKDMYEVTAGKNRVEKAAAFANQVLSRPKQIIQCIKVNFSAQEYLELHDRERKALVLALLCSTYPIVYHFIVLLGTAFRSQKEIGRSYINQKVASQYGSNRTLDIAIDAIIPMAIGLDTIQRTRTSFYEALPAKAILHPIIAEIYVYTDIVCSGTKSILKDEISNRPWYCFYQPQAYQPGTGNLVSYSSGMVGGGYIGI